MSRGKVGTKNGREERNRAFQDGLRARKKLRRDRRHAHGVLNLYEQENDVASLSRLVPDADWQPDHLPDEVIAVFENVVGEDNFVKFDALATQEHAHPSEQEWADVVDTAKRRKRSIKTFAQKAGWALTGDDPKNREHWTAY